MDQARVVHCVDTGRDGRHFRLPTFRVRILCSAFLRPPTCSQRVHRRGDLGPRHRVSSGQRIACVPICLKFRSGVLLDPNVGAMGPQCSTTVIFVFGRMYSHEPEANPDLRCSDQTLGGLWARVFGYHTLCALRVWADVSMGSCVTWEFLGNLNACSGCFSAQPEQITGKITKSNSRLSEKEKDTCLIVLASRREQTFNSSFTHHQNLGEFSEFIGKVSPPIPALSFSCWNRS